MNSKEAWQSYFEFSSLTSEIIRKYAYAIIGIFWILKKQDGTFSNYILLVFIFLSLFFLFDVLQYFISSTNKKRELENEEKKRRKNEESIEFDNFYFSVKCDQVPFMFWKLKILAMILGYVFLIIDFLVTYNLFDKISICFKYITQTLK